VSDDIAPHAHAARFLDAVGGDPEHRTAIYGAGGDEASFASAAASGERFGHENNIIQSDSPDGMSRTSQRRFDGPALYAALDEQRQLCGLSWHELAGQLGVADSTLRNTRNGGPMETDGILAMLGWLKRKPEDFVHGAKQSLARAAVSRKFGRLNSAALYAALDAERRARGLTWRRLAEEIGGVSASMLTHLCRGGRAEISLVVAAAEYFDREVLSFTRPE
jgi:transcriptional regulator with XRE-family HTH domain